MSLPTAEQHFAVAYLRFWYGAAFRESSIIDDPQERLALLGRPRAPAQKTCQIER